MNFRIEENVQKPARRNVGRKSEHKYNFADMQVGQSFKWAFTTEDNAETREKITRRVRTAAKAFNKAHPEYVFETWTAFGTDEQETDNLDGIRVKRIAESKREAKGGEGAIVNAVGARSEVLSNGHDTSVSA